LVNQILPRIRGTVPRSVRPVGAEDAEELVQDTVAMAAKLLDRNEATGKPMFPSSIAYYSIQHAKSGRRFVTGAGSSDVMSPRTQLEGHSAVSSFDDPIAFDEFTGEPLTLTEMISGDREDPSTVAARSIDWEAFLATQSPRGCKVVQLLAEGCNALQTARTMKLAPWQVYAERDKVAKALRAHMGERILDDIHVPPLWHGNLNCSKERLACRERHRGI
jgi:hypothetical protein